MNCPRSPDEALSVIQIEVAEDEELISKKELLTSEKAFDENACLLNMTSSLRGERDFMNLAALKIKKKRMSKLNMPNIAG